MARAYSEDVSANNGGDIGIFERGKMVAEFENAAFSPKPGEVSDIVESQYGLHLIKKERDIPGRGKSLDEVHDKIRQILGNQIGKKKYEEWIRELKETSFVEILLFDNPLENTHLMQVGGETAIFGITDFKGMEEELKHIMTLRQHNTISETEYKKRKSELLDKL